MRRGFPVPFYGPLPAAQRYARGWRRSGRTEKRRLIPWLPHLVAPHKLQVTGSEAVASSHFSSQPQRCMACGFLGSSKLVQDNPGHLVGDLQDVGLAHGMTVTSHSIPPGPTVLFSGVADSQMWSSGEQVSSRSAALTGRLARIAKW